MRIGAHLSTAGKVYNAIDLAVQHGIQDVQIFPWSPRMWGPFNYKDEDIAEFKQRRIKAGIKSVVFHNVYLINLAGENHPEKSQKSFEAAIQQAEVMGVDGVVVHLGHNPDSEAGLGRIIKSVYGALKYVDKSGILIETTAGTKNAIGASFKDLGKIIKGVGSPKVNILVDTCHIWAAGYDLKSPKGFKETMAELDAEIGFKRVKGFHLNDTKGELGGGRDRHENIGKGYMGLPAFKNLMNFKPFADTPGYLETPRDTDNDLDNDVKALRKLVK